MFGALLSIVAVVGIRWVWVFRHGQPYDIDEAGYLSIALSHHHALIGGGLHDWWSSVVAPSIQAPLTMAMTTPVFLIAGARPIVGLVVPLLLGLLAVAGAFLLARRIGGPRMGWLAGLLCLGAPLLLNYSRSYNFAITATAALTLALLAMARSENLDRPSWSVALGAFLGLTALARTMALAFLPALLLAMAVSVAAGPNRGRRAVNAATALAVCVVVALPWYLPNGHLVYDYLTSFGYGSRAGEFGTGEPFLSLAAWRVTAKEVALSVFLPYLVLLVGGGAALAGVAVSQIRRRGARSVAVAMIRSPLMPSAFLVLEGLAVLTSSENRGSAFLAPLIPAMAVCAAWAFVRLPVRPRDVVTAWSVLVVAVNLLASSDLRAPFARPWLVTMPVIGIVPVTDGRGTLQRYEAGDRLYDNPSAEPFARRQGAAWVAASVETAARIRTSGGPVVVTAFGFRHRLVNLNTVQLEELRAGAPTLPLTQVAPVVTSDTVDGYSRWLGSGDASRACNLLIASGSSNEYTPAVTPALMEQAAYQQGFVNSAEWSLPDGRVVSLWRRPMFCP